MRHENWREYIVTCYARRSTIKIKVNVTIFLKEMRALVSLKYHHSSAIKVFLFNPAQNCHIERGGGHEQMIETSNMNPNFQCCNHFFFCLAIFYRYVTVQHKT